MNAAQMGECLALLRQADEMLMAENELAVAVHLSRAIEELEQAQQAQAETGRQVRPA